MSDPQPSGSEPSGEAASSESASSESASSESTSSESTSSQAETVKSAEPATGRTRHARLGVYAVFCLGVSALLLALYSSWAPIGTIHGKILHGDVERVALVDVSRDVFRNGSLVPGGYSVDLPPFSYQPRVFVYGKGEPPHWVEGGVLPRVEGDQEAPPMALWSTPLELTIREGTLRFDWSPIPEGEGYPRRRRYSLLIRYRSLTGERKDATLICTGPKRSITLYELEQLFQEFDTTKRELEIELRALDPGEQKGPLWIGHRRTWTLPPSVAPEPLAPLPPGGRH